MQYGRAWLITGLKLGLGFSRKYTPSHFKPSLVYPLPDRSQRVWSQLGPNDICDPETADLGARADLIPVLDGERPGDGPSTARNTNSWSEPRDGDVLNKANGE